MKYIGLKYFSANTELLIRTCFSFRSCITISYMPFLFNWAKYTSTDLYTWLTTN